MQPGGKLVRYFVQILADALGRTFRHRPAWRVVFRSPGPGHGPAGDGQPWYEFGHLGNQLNRGRLRRELRTDVAGFGVRYSILYLEYCGILWDVGTCLCHLGWPSLKKIRVELHLELASTWNPQDDLINYHEIPWNLFPLANIYFGRWFLHIPSATARCLLMLGNEVTVFMWAARQRLWSVIPSSLVGLFHGKSHLHMDFVTGGKPYFRKPPNSVSRFVWHCFTIPIPIIFQPYSTKMRVPPSFYGISMAFP